MVMRATWSVAPVTKVREDKPQQIWVFLFYMSFIIIMAFVRLPLERALGKLKSRVAVKE